MPHCTPYSLVVSWCCGVPFNRRLLLPFRFCFYLNSKNWNLLLFPQSSLSFYMCSWFVHDILFTVIQKILTRYVRMLSGLNYAAEYLIAHGLCIWKGNKQRENYILIQILKLFSCIHSVKHFEILFYIFCTLTV